MMENRREMEVDLLVLRRRVEDLRIEDSRLDIQFCYMVWLIMG
jgi:hypothetical protein